MGVSLIYNVVLVSTLLVETHNSWCSEVIQLYTHTPILFKFFPI